MTPGPLPHRRPRRAARARTPAWHRNTHDREILRLAIPAFGALVAEPLFLLADSAIIGRLGTAQLAGLGVAGAILVTAVGLCVFLAYGTTASVARRSGAGDRRGALAQGMDGLWLALGVGVVITAAGWGAAPALIDTFGASASAGPYALVYLRISLFGIPSMLLVLAATGVLRGLQDTRTPLVVAATAALANLGLNLALVYGAGLGVAGSALGTVLAQTGAAAWLVAIVVRAARAEQAPLRPDRLGIRAAGAAGVPLLVRTLTLRAALLVATYVATAQGDVALASHHVAFAVWNLLALALDALAIAGQAIVGRYLGASDAVGARAATRRMIEWGVLGGVVGGLLVVVARPAYVPLFSTDPEVRRLLASVLIVVAVMQPVAGVVFVLDGVLIGSGDGRYLAGAGIAALAVFLPCAGFVLATAAGLVALWWAIAVLMLARLATLVLRARTDAWLVTGAAR
jgi:putative MATE family efflux protein